MECSTSRKSFGPTSTALFSTGSTDGGGSVECGVNRMAKALSARQHSLRCSNHGHSAPASPCPLSILQSCRGGSVGKPLAPAPRGLPSRRDLRQVTPWGSPLAPSVTREKNVSKHYVSPKALENAGGLNFPTARRARPW